MSFVWIQLLFSGAVLAVVAQRVYVLCFRAPVSEAYLRAIEASFDRGDVASAEALCQALASRFACRVGLSALERDGGADGTELALLEVFEDAGRFLSLLRVSATLSSTLGLLGGILLIRAGFGGHAGLLSLQAGLAERTALAHALLTMAIGVGTAAVAYTAFAVLTRESRRAYQQAQRVAQRARPPR